MQHRLQNHCKYYVLFVHICKNIVKYIGFYIDIAFLLIFHIIFNKHFKFIA